VCSENNNASKNKNALRVAKVYSSRRKPFMEEKKVGTIIIIYYVVILLLYLLLSIFFQVPINYIIYNNTNIIWKEIKMTLRNWVRSVPMSRTGAATWAKTPRAAQKTTVTNPWLGVVLQIGSHDLRHNENQPVSSYSGRFGRIYCHVLYCIRA